MTEMTYLAHVISRHSKISYRYNFFNYLAFTYFILLWGEMTEMTILHVNVIASLVGAFRRTLSTVQSMNGKHDCVHMWNVKVKVRALAIAPLTWVRLVTSSALQSWKWQLIGMSQWCHSALCEDEGGIILNICCKHLVLFRATWPQNRLFSEPPTVHQRKCVALYVFSVWYFARHTRI